MRAAIRTPNWQFIGRGTLLAVAALLLAGAALFGLLFPGIPYGPVPEAPAIQLPAGPLPPPQVGLRVWAEYAGREPGLAGSGFFLELPDGRLVGVTAAHSFRLTSELEAISLAAPGALARVRLDTLHGNPGAARLFGNNLTGDYLLLVTALQLEVEAAQTPVTSDNPVSDPQPPAGLPTSPTPALGYPPDLRGGPGPGLVLVPDPRGGPQPGERVVVYSGVLAEPQGGAVFSSGGRGAWAVMDAPFEAALTSGAPVFSEHTGLIVGMALVAGQREGRLVLGIHPIGSLVEKGLAAEVAIPLGSTR